MIRLKYCSTAVPESNQSVITINLRVFKTGLRDPTLEQAARVGPSKCFQLRLGGLLD